MSFGMHPAGTSPVSYLDADHDHIESPEALYRHLYEEHHVEEARDLDPETAPVQFWLRRHAELERAARRDASRDDAGDLSDAGDASSHHAADARDARDAGEAAEGDPEDVREGTVGAARTTPRRPRGETSSATARDASRDASRDTGRGRVPDFQRPEPRNATRRRSSDDRASGQGSSDRASSRSGDDRASVGARHGQDAAAGSGGDPLLHAIVAALVRRGHDERAVVRYISACPDPDGAAAGPDAFRDRFVRPMLDAVARELTAVRRPPAEPTAAPEPSATPEPPTPREPTVTPPRHALPRSHPQPRGRTQPREDRRTPKDPADLAADDVMALADAVQRPQVQHARPAHPVMYKLDDDVMALADAVQRPRGG